MVSITVEFDGDECVLRTNDDEWDDIRITEGQEGYVVVESTLVDLAETHSYNSDKLHYTSEEEVVKVAAQEMGDE